MSRSPAFLSLRAGRLLVGAVVVSAAVLVLTGYLAVVEWRNAASMVAVRRAQSAADLLVGALARDMRGAQLQVLTSIERDRLSFTSPVDFLHPAATGLARYPYPEAFFAWGSQSTQEAVAFYSRADRRPAWLAEVRREHPFPVVIGHEPDIAKRLMARVMEDAWLSRRYSIFELTIDGAPYQVVALLCYADSLDEQPAGAFGFLVNLDWARRHYFDEIAGQMAQIEGGGGVQFVVFDDRGTAVVEHGISAPGLAGVPQGRSPFPVAFFDPMDVAIDPPKDLEIPTWTAVASALGDPTVGIAERGARGTLALGVIMTLALTAGIVLSLQAGRASARLGDMRADFVSAVTHELKTPIANLRAISETMASGRCSLEMSREYAQMGIREAARLSRLIDNLLAYARVTDVADVYTFESVPVHSLVRQALQEFALNLEDGRFEVRVDIPEDLPAVRADPTALALLFDNLIDNAIRYSGDQKSLTIAARRERNAITLTVADKGIGISEDEIHRVRQKFQRGADALGGGSGLGLAIVERIVADHGGSMAIQSAPGLGTTVAVTLPVAA